LIGPRSFMDVWDSLAGGAGTFLMFPFEVAYLRRRKVFFDEVTHNHAGGCCLVVLLVFSFPDGPRSKASRFLWPSFIFCCAGLLVGSSMVKGTTMAVLGVLLPNRGCCSFRFVFWFVWFTALLSREFSGWPVGFRHVR